jgi:hypothetical protein
MNNAGKEGLPAELEIQALVPTEGNEEQPIILAIVLTSAPKFPFNFVFETKDPKLVSRMASELVDIAERMIAHPANEEFTGTHVGTDSGTDNATKGH